LMEEVGLPLGVTEVRGSVGMSPLHWAAKRGISSIVNLLIASSPAVADAWSELRGGPLGETPERMMARARGAPGVSLAGPTELEPSEWDGTLASHFVNNEEVAAPGRQAIQTDLHLPPAWHTSDRSQQGSDWNSATIVGAAELYRLSTLASSSPCGSSRAGSPLRSFWPLPVHTA